MNQQSQIERKALSIPQAAAMLSLSRSGVYRALNRNELKSLRVGGRRLILASSIDALLAVETPTSLSSAPVATPSWQDRLKSASAGSAAHG